MMLREILHRVEELVDEKIENQTRCLVSGVKPKVHIPLMKRPKCDSLEERIEHYAKRKRIEIVDDETT